METVVITGTTALVLTLITVAVTFGWQKVISIDDTKAELEATQEALDERMKEYQRLFNLRGDTITALTNRVIELEANGTGLSAFPIEAQPQAFSEIPEQRPLTEQIQEIKSRGKN
jgi:hypothetical protein